MAISAVQRRSAEAQQILSLNNSPIRSSFEFLPISGSPMCFADDIFSGGQFVSGAPKEPSEEDLNCQEQKKRLIMSDHRRKSPDGRLMKSNSYGAEGKPSKKKPKWYVLAFGSIFWVPEIQLSDMRSRVKKLRSDSTLKSMSSGGTWKLIRSLSCRADIGGVVDDELVA